MREVCNVSEREGGQGKLPFRGLDWTGTIWQKGELDIYEGDPTEKFTHALAL